MLRFSCYVLGCKSPAVIGCRHVRFGRVVSCQGHNPIRHAYDRELITTQPAGVSFSVPDSPLPELPDIGPDTQPGDGVPRVPRPVPMSPAGVARTLSPAGLAGW